MHAGKYRNVSPLRPELYCMIKIQQTGKIANTMGMMYFFFHGHDKKYYKKIDEGVDIDLVVCYTTTVKPKTAGFCKSIPLSCRGESSVFICAFHMFKAL